jgi:ribosomal-protein-alanine N-acetyltransferase
MTAFDTTTGIVAGVVLTSFVGPHTGHITQLGVMPHAQGMGIGRDLLERAMDALYRNGAKRISLTVTVANERALGLYRRAGFRELRRFAACMYEAHPVSARS